MKKVYPLHVRFSKEDVERMKKLVESGKYPSVSEVVRTAVRRLLRDEYRCGH